MQSTFDNKTLRNVAGAFATGITVVTTTKEDGSIHGMTANSFLSVSLDPPLVAFSVREQGSMMKYLKKGKAVSISILSEEQEPVSNQFAGRNEPSFEVQFEKHQEGVPTIKDSLAWYNTKVKNIIPAGDHFLILCQVTNLHRAENGSPLLYYSGYKSIAS